MAPGGKNLLKFDFSEAIALFFETCIKQISNAIQQQLGNFDAKVLTVPKLLSCAQLQIAVDIQHILLVGGFGESKYLQNVLRDTFASETCDLTVIDDGT